MGVLDKIVKEAERVGDSVGNEFERMGRDIETAYEKTGKYLYRYLTLEELRAMGRAAKDPFGIQEAQEEARKAQRQLLADKLSAQQTQQLRQTAQSKLLAGERARMRREMMAESLISGGTMLMDTSIQGNNTTVNRITQLEPVDETGNSIPEVS